MATPAGSDNPYEGVDALEQFSSREALEAYRTGLLAKSEREVSFIAREVGTGPFRVLDLGTGNGRLMIALAMRGMVRSGTGVDNAVSRIAFARRWAADLSLDNMLSFVAEDAFQPRTWLQGKYDLMLGISNVLGFLRVVHAEAALDLVRVLYRHLSPAGCLLLEVYQLTNARREILALSGNRIRTWIPLPSWDRFAYYLSDFSYDASSGVLGHVKTFIGRDGGIDAGRQERMGFVTRAELVESLESVGCASHRAFGSWAGDPHSDGRSSTILLACGSAWHPPAEPTRPGIPLRTAEAVPPDGPGAWVF